MRSPLAEDVAAPTLALLRSRGAVYEVLGGGRIVRDDERKTIDIFGYSVGFPWENDVFRHEDSAKVVRDALPQYTVTTSNEGY